jgi:ribonuclease T2
MKALALALLSVPGIAPALAMAQAYNCVPPERVVMPAPPRPDEPARRTPISHYLLAVSWSPEYCRDDRESMQCSRRNGRFGFVLHGLWPEGRQGQWPQWCSVTPRPAPQLLRANLCMTPSAVLLEHAWAKHGSCMTKTPERYYRVAGTLWRGLRWPDADRLSRQDGLTAGDLRRAVAERNPGWRPEAVGILLSRTGWLRELRLCYDRNFMPMPCPRANFGPPDSAPIKIWRGL